MKRFQTILCSLLIAFLGACTTTVQSTADSSVLDARAKWALLPIVNNTETPQAALAAESLLEHLLRGRGVRDLSTYPASLSRDSLFEPTERKVAEEAQVWAKGQGARYGLTGSVQEWRYKVGVDGEPVVGITLKVIDLSSGETLWSVTGAHSGWSRESLSGVAQTLLTQLLAGMKLADAANAGKTQP
jgi:TolB-like protein